jgi:integrase
VARRPRQHRARPDRRHRAREDQAGRRQTFTAGQVVQILEANTDARDQVALRLLLFFGIRKGALRRIQLDHFDAEKRTVTITTKGGKIQTLQIVDDTVWKLFDELREPDTELPATEARHTAPRTADTEGAGRAGDDAGVMYDAPGRRCS